eukprot:s51_g20.t1
MYTNIRLNPYLYYFFHRVPGHSTDVVIERLSPAGLHVPLDLWYVPSSGARDSPRPVLFLIHGGAWRGGEARCSPQAPMLHSLAASGFLIVSCEYRRRRGAAWPNQLKDCSAALEWLINEGAALYCADLSDVTIAGTSAGGHLAALLLTKLLQDAKPMIPHAAMLFYPALDPADRFTNSTVRIPFSCSPLGVRYQMSALDGREWFFQLIVLHGNEDLWPSAEPMRQLETVDRDCVSRWPPTLIVHGDCDGVVPIEHSAAFLRRLAAWRPRPSKDQLLTVPGARHSFEIVYGDLSDSCYNAALSWLQKIRGEHSQAKPAV